MIRIVSHLFAFAFALMAALIAGIIIGISIASPARAHDGYEPECCNNVHCKPIASPARQGAFWVLPDGRRFQAGTTRHSSVIGKTGFHLCEWGERESIPQTYEQTRIVQPKGRPVCLYVPEAEH